jgi:translation initiation factor IF-2
LFGTPTGKNDAGKPVSTLSDTSSPLSEVIQAMRADKERRRAMEANEDPALRPKWRQSDGSMRRRRLGDAEAQANMWESSNRLESRVRQRQGKPVDSEETGGKLLQLPSYEMNLIEVSLLLRVSTQRLRKVLRSMGELPRGKVEDKDIVVHPEILEYVALDLGIGFEKVDRTIQSDEELLLQRRATAEQSADMYETYAPRPPVVCIMGHVDHGKTTLMDALRRRATEGEGKPQKKVGKAKKNKAAASKKASGGNVAGTEAGGITQVISAFQVPLPDADVGAVTFLDTPGHAAFRSMRQSGSDAADVVVLVVAADDGVSPQTVEIIEFYKSIVTSSGSGISMVVALNKIDKPGVDVERARTMVEGQLLEHGIVTERMGSESDFGPPVQLIPVSGLSGQGLDELIGGLVLQSEVMDLRADANACAEGVVLDARMEKGLGVVADCIIRWGSITKGDIVVSGTQKGKVRFLRDVGGKTIKQGIPSQPVRIVGFEELPKAGDPFICMELEEEADAAVERRLAAIETEAIAKADGPSTAHAELQSAGKHLMSYDWRTRLQQRHGIDDNEDGGPIRIPVILRADADGTLAALRESVVAIGEASSHNIVIDPIQTGIGPALPTDVEMAKESQAAILCFNVNNDVQKEADEASVKVLRSDVIYSILDDARVYFGSYLPAEAKETIHGRAKVGAIFSIGGIDTKVAGLQVLEGNLYRDKIPASKTSSGQATAIFRVLRNGDVIESTIQGMPATSLKHFKEDVTEIGRGKECGLSLANFGDFEEGDEIECWSVSMEHQPL